MDWVTCPKCGFTQIPTEKCLRCARPLAPADVPGRAAAPLTPTAPVSVPTLPDAAAPSPDGETAPDIPTSAPPDAPAAAPAQAQPSPPAVAERRARPRSSPALPEPASAPVRRRIGPAVAVAAAAVLVTLAFLLGRGQSHETRPQPTPAARAMPARVLDLSGRWETQFSKTLGGSPPRPALKQVFLETDREGAILAAGVLLTDPGRGGAGAGYRLVADGRERLAQVAAALAGSPGGATLPQIDFVPLPAWMPARERAWRALEGQSRKLADVRYLLLESVEDDYLVQAGLNGSGFLSYAFFSREYAHNRGVDGLSGVIHPDPGGSLRGFRNLVWDLSGAADFLSLEVHATLSGPEGSISDRLSLKRLDGSGGGKK
jgi:hypothetical protein